MKHFTIRQIAAALRKTDGIPAHAAKLLGTGRTTVHDRIARSPVLQALVKEITTDLDDQAEGNIAALLRAGDVQITKWYAERKLRHRGYGTKIEAGIDDGQVEAFIASLGGDIGKYRAALAAIESAERR